MSSKLLVTSSLDAITIFTAAHVLGSTVDSVEGRCGVHSDTADAATLLRFALR